MTLSDSTSLSCFQVFNTQCKNFKCEAGRTDCCCRRVMFCQPDFVVQKLHLEEYVTSRGHICDFYPKFHCKLNLIEQYWGVVKFCYRSSPKTADMDAMERNVLACLDDVPLLQIKQWAFICFAAAKYISDSSLVMLIDLPALSQLTPKVYQARRQHGQIGNIMVIGLCLRVWLLRSKRHLALRST
jgi:hypothetical protein